MMNHCFLMGLFLQGRSFIRVWESTVRLIDTSFTWSTIYGARSESTCQGLVFDPPDMCHGRSRRHRENTVNPCAVSPRKYYQWNEHLRWNATDLPGDMEELVLWSPSLHCPKWATVNSSLPVNPWGGSQENPIIFGGRQRSNWQPLLRQQSSRRERGAEGERYVHHLDVTTE